MKRLARIYSISQSDMRRIAPNLPSREPRLRGKRIIPVSEPNIRDKEIQYVNHAVRSSWLSSVGDYVDAFEKSFARIVSKTKYAVAVNSGTSALHTALAALGVSTGDEVILPTFTMIATINAVAYCGATPVLVDADPQTWNIDVSKIEKAITKKTKAIIVVHTYGLPASMDEIMRIAKERNLWVIEDAAEAQGALYKGKSVGGIGDVGAFSLYANKLITTGEGGVVVTNNPEIAKRIRLLHNHAFSKERHFWHTMIGFGYRMTNLQAAVGVAQLERFDELLEKKRLNAALYLRLLEGVSGLTLSKDREGVRHSFWMYGILVDKKKFGMDKNKLREFLASRGIETRSFFIPLHFQPPYAGLFPSEQFPVSEHLCRDGLYLPSSTTLRAEDIEYISGHIRSASAAR